MVFEEHLVEDKQEEGTAERCGVSLHTQQIVVHAMWFTTSFTSCRVVGSCDIKCCGLFK